MVIACNHYASQATSCIPNVHCVCKRSCNLHDLIKKLFFTRGGYVSCLRAYLDARLLPQSYQYPNHSEGADRVGG